MTAKFIGGILGAAFVVWLGWYFFGLTKAECYMTWLIVMAGSNGRRGKRGHAGPPGPPGPQGLTGR